MTLLRTHSGHKAHNEYEKLFRNVFSPNPQLVITRPQVDLRKTSCTLKLVKQIVDSRHSILVLDGDTIKLTIVDAQAKRSILLLSKKSRCSPRRCTWTNKPQLLQLHLQFSQFGGSKTIRRQYINRCGTGK